MDLFGDVVLDVDVKPNRGDALSILGLAREVAAATGQQVRMPEITVHEGSGPSTADRLAVEVRDPDLCTGFAGRWVSGVTIGPSPDAVQMRLLAAGQRPISNVVDVSNYVMLELGKPIHTFDAAAVHPVPTAAPRSSCAVRRRASGSRRSTTWIASSPGTCCSSRIRPVPSPSPASWAARSSEVSDRTRDVVIESAIFDPVSIRRTAQRLALRSEASSRFEKGQEPRMARLGADRTAQLIRRWAGGEIAPGVVDIAPVLPGPTRVAFRPARVNRLLGMDLSVAEQQELLARVGVATEPRRPVSHHRRAQARAACRWPSTRSPSRRSSRPGAVTSRSRLTWLRRSHGCAATTLVPSVTPDTAMPVFRASPLEIRELVRETLAGAGLTEIVAAALVSPRHIETFVLSREVPSIGDEPQPGGDSIGVTNPLSRDHSLLRRDLLGRLLDVVGVNLRHGTRGRRDLRDRQGLCPHAAPSHASGGGSDRARRRRRARGLEPHGPAL